VENVSARTARAAGKELLFRSTLASMFFVNIRFMFNGDSLAFVKGYRLKDDGR
jgi:hypothetical protein